MLKTPNFSRFLNVLTCLILASLILSSCDIQKQRTRQVKRAERKVFKLVTKYPELKQKDTLTIRDSFTIPKIEHDTVVQLKDQDTLFIDKERLKIRIIRRNDTFQITGKCDTVFVDRIVEVPVETIQINTGEVKLSWWQKLWKRFYILLALIGAISIILLILAFAFGVVRFGLGGR